MGTKVRFTSRKVRFECMRDFILGKGTVFDVARDHGVKPRTLEDIAKRGGWQRMQDEHFARRHRREIDDGARPLGAEAQFRASDDLVRAARARVDQAHEVFLAQTDDRRREVAARVFREVREQLYFEIHGHWPPTPGSRASQRMEVRPAGAGKGRRPGDVKPLGRTSDPQYVVVDQGESLDPETGDPTGSETEQVSN